MSKLSVVISAFNSQDTLEDCLKSVIGVADEIIVVDNQSLDNTVKIAEKYNSKIFTRKNNLMLNVNKNFGFEQANSEWILSLDSDERLTEELRDEIKSKINASDGLAKSEISGYWMPRKNIIFGKWIKHAGWYPDFQLRLFKKNKGRFPQEHVHEMIKVEGKLEYLKNDIVHYNYKSISGFLEKLNNIYTVNEAESLLLKGYVVKPIDAIRFPLGEFMSRYFAREGYKDGFYGFMLSVLMAFYHFVVFAKAWEKQGLIDNQNENFVFAVEKEAKRGYKELIFWFFEKKIKKAAGVGKIWLKIWQKLIG